MYDLRKDIKEKKKFSLNFFKKLKWKHLLYLILILILIFPVKSGEIIGNWILDFFETIIKTLKDAE